MTRTETASSAAEIADLSDAAAILYGGRYELIDLVGAGGAGTVYRARDIELDEIVALKVLRKELVRSKELIERFRSEVKLARRVTHRNVARMFDIGEHEGERFLTMEFVEGQMLSARLNIGADGNGRPLPNQLVLEVTKQVCAGLAAAHAVGVIHRDLKPDNVMVANDGRVAITDFGIARAWKQNDAGSTHAEKELIGTPEYMSPEQAEGSAIDARTDVYSLGVMLFELLTGTVPFTGPNPLITAAARLLKPPPDPRGRRADLPESVAQVVLRCMAKKPQDRYAHAEEVAAALEAAFAGSGALSATTPSVSTQRVTVSEGLLSSDSSARPTFGLGETLASVDAQKAIAVLPFRNQGPAEDAYLADGLTDDLIDSLSNVRGLRVASRSALRTHAAITDPLAQGRALHVDVLVDGSVRRAGPTLRIAARLVQVTDGVQVWAQRFDRPASDALVVNDEVAQAVAGALTVENKVPVRTVLQDAEAVDLYLRARALSQAGDPAGLRESVPLLERALALRPTDPTLLTQYAQVRARLWFFGGEGSGELAQAAAEQAVAAAPQRGEPYLALSTVRFHIQDPVGAVRTLKQALQLSPNLASAHDLLGRILLESGPHELGLRHIAQAIELDPAIARVQIDRPRLYALLGNWKAVDEIVDQQITPDRSAVGAWLVRARMALWRRDRERALRYLQDKDIGNPYFVVPRKILEITAGVRRYEIQEIFEPGLGSRASSPRGRGFFHQAETELFAFHGEVDTAVRSLARSVDVGLYDRMWIDYCPLLVPLRVDLRFQALRRIVIDRAKQVQGALQGQ